MRTSWNMPKFRPCSHNAGFVRWCSEVVITWKLAPNDTYQCKQTMSIKARCTVPSERNNLTPQERCSVHWIHFERGEQNPSLGQKAIGCEMKPVSCEQALVWCIYLLEISTSRWWPQSHSICISCTMPPLLHNTLLLHRDCISNPFLLNSANPPHALHVNAGARGLGIVALTFVENKLLSLGEQQPHLEIGQFLEPRLEWPRLPLLEFQHPVGAIALLTMLSFTNWFSNVFVFIPYKLFA